MNDSAAAVDPTKVRLAFELKHSVPLLGCRFDPSGAFVFAGAQDSTIQRWHLESKAQTALPGHASWVRPLAFADGKLYSGDYHGKVLVWRLDADSPSPERSLEAHRGWVRSLAVSPDRRQLATCGNDLMVRLWSTADGGLIRELPGHAHHVYSVAFHPSGRALASADLHGVVKVWDLERGTETRTLDASVLFRYDPTFRADHGGVRSMAFSRDGNLLACAGITDVTNAFAGVGKPAVVLFDWNTGQRRQLLRPSANFQGTAWGVDIHPSGLIAAAGGGSGGAMWFWRADQPASVHHLTVPANARDLHLHPDGRRLAVACFDGAVRVYEFVA
jgi:hypothetical protein